MRRAKSIRLAVAVMAFCLALIPNSAPAQQEKGIEAATTEQKPTVAYRIEFNVREIEDGKRLNSRNYMMLVRDGGHGMIRVGNKVPYQASDKEFQYQDVGMNIDCDPHAREDSIALEITLDSTSVLAQEQRPGVPFNPVFRQQRGHVSAVVTPGKPTLVASMDDVITNRRYEIEVTATKEK